jgi:hypothetical protein
MSYHGVDFGDETVERPVNTKQTWVRSVFYGVGLVVFLTFALTTHNYVTLPAVSFAEEETTKEVEEEDSKKGYVKEEAQLDPRNVIGHETAREEEAKETNTMPPNEGEENPQPIYRVTGNLQNTVRFFHISDSHIDPLFDPTMSMQAGICHSCKLSDKAFGLKAFCPKELPVTEGGEEHLANAGYAFGRYGCNPPHKLVRSLFKHLKDDTPNPEFIAFTGDICPHGYPGDKYNLTPQTKIEDMCDAKFKALKMSVDVFTSTFPETKWAFTMGNNDHFPKNTYWQPWITKIGNMFLETGFFTEDQHAQFIKHGGNYIDHEGLRLLSPDLTLFSPGGEVTFVTDADIEGLSIEQATAKKYPVREAAVQWISDALAGARRDGLKVIFIGHQPLTTNKGEDELDVEGLHYGRMKLLLQEYSDIITTGLFGHRNLAGIQEVLSPTDEPIFPSITAPGISPRGENQPCFNVIYIDRETKIVQEFEQWTFDLMNENEIAKLMPNGYLGEWRQHNNDVYSWRALSGETEFTALTLSKTVDRIPHDSKIFFSIETWKRAGYIGDETPENYYCKAIFDEAKDMIPCLFPNQDMKCWDDDWLE